MSSSLEALAERIAYPLSNASLLELALTHRSVSGDNNERLEFLGDAFLNLVVAVELYGRFPHADEGELSRLRANLVNGVTLAKLARHLGLGEQLRLGPGELKSGGFRRESILAGALEAVIGAAYLDGGFDAASRVIHAVFADQFAAIAVDVDLKDPKTRLQEYLQARKMALPQYQVLVVEGHAHAQLFRVECRMEELDRVTQGEGSSRRKAEQEAARKALEELEKSNE